VLISWHLNNCIYSPVKNDWINITHKLITTIRWTLFYILVFSKYWTIDSFLLLLSWNLKFFFNNIFESAEVLNIHLWFELNNFVHTFSYVTHIDIINELFIGFDKVYRYPLSIIDALVGLQNCQLFRVYE